MAKKKTKKRTESGDWLEMEEDAPTGGERPREVAGPTGPVSTEPTDLDEYEGEYVQTSTGETYGLKVVENDPHGRTHHAKNVDHFWSGTEDEFKLQFERE
jgi:hypothetical protein